MSEATKATIRKIIADKLGRSIIDVQPDVAVGGSLEDDSLDQIEIVMALEDEFDIEIPDEVCSEWKTVADVFAHIEKVKIGG